MHYTTVTVGLVAGHEKDGINDAIAQGLNELKEEINGTIELELVNVAHVVIGEKLCVTILAKPYQPPNAGILEAMKALGWGPETTRGTIVKPFMSGVLPL
jgi:hypothetical protein